MSGAIPAAALERFVRAQDPLMTQVRAELASGRKRGHWMWFVFPQLRGLGSSPMAEHYAIASIEEAIDYLRHPVLGARLADCAATVNAVRDTPIGTIFPYPDDLKFHSCMTLFSRAARRADAPAYGEIFHASLEKYFAGRPDSRTLELLGAGADWPAGAD